MALGAQPVDHGRLARCVHLALDRSPARPPRGNGSGPSVGLAGDPQDLLDRGDAGHGLAQAVLEHRPHAGSERGALQLDRLGVLEQLPADRIGHHQHLVDADPAVIAGAAALLAALRPPERDLLARSKPSWASISGSGA